MAQWTNQDDEQLTLLYKRGLSCSEIGAQMGRTRHAIIGRVHRIGTLEMRGHGKRDSLTRVFISSKWTEDEDRTLKQLYLAGNSYAVIAEKMGKSRQSVVARARRIVVGRIARPKITVAATPEPRPRAEPELIRLRCAAIEPLHVSLLDLEPHHCRYPFGERDFTFCGHPKADGKSYCRDHAELVVGQGSYSERTAHKALLAA